MKATPDKLIEELRELARAGSVDVFPGVKLEEMIEWSAADFIAAAGPLLERLAERDDDHGRAARDVLAGRYPTTRE